MQHWHISANSWENHLTPVSCISYPHLILQVCFYLSSKYHEQSVHHSSYLGFQGCGEAAIPSGGLCNIKLLRVCKMSRRYFLQGHSSFKIASSPSIKSCTSASLGTSCPFSCRLESVELGSLALAGYTTRALSLSANWILGCLSVNFSILFMFMGFVVAPYVLQAPSCGAEDFWHNQCIWEDGCIVHLINAKHPQKNSLVKI